MYVVTNRAEVVCLDLDGQADGNEGPYLDEGRHMAPAGTPPMKVTPIDADIVWLYDMPAELSVHPHDSPHSSILIDGPFLYLNTSNGLDRIHSGVPQPDAPSLIVLDKQTGRLVAKDGERIGPRVFHCTWSSPSLGIVNGQRRVFFCGGDGVCYGFRPIEEDNPAGSVTVLTSLDFLGIGLPPGSASLGELLAQGKANLQAPWLGLTGFFVIGAMLSLLIFVGEAVRDAFDPRKTIG